MVPLTADGLSVTAPIKKVYDGWPYPADWVVEGFAQEGPKMLKHGEYYYMVLAEGGTAGPPTSHMVIAARSKAIEGPWENSPYNAIIRTKSADERWWSKGHATLVEGPDRRWYAVYHAYEKMGVQWSFYKGTATDTNRYRYDNGSLVLKAKGTTPADSSPLWFVAGDHAYEIQVEIDIDPGATAGVLVFYNSRLYAGLGYSATDFVMHRYGQERVSDKPAHLGRTLHMRLTNDRHIVTIDYSADGKAWERFGTRMEVSGYHHNVAYDFLSLRPALYAAGQGEVRFRNFRYRALGN